MTKKHAKKMKRVVDLHNEVFIANEAVFVENIKSSNAKLGNNSSRTAPESLPVNMRLSSLVLLPLKRPATSVSKRDKLI